MAMVDELNKIIELERVAGLKLAHEVARLQADLEQAGWCDKHKPSASQVYNACWRCSREEESAALEQAVEVRDQLSSALSVKHHELEQERNERSDMNKSYGRVAARMVCAEAELEQAQGERDALRLAINVAAILINQNVSIQDQGAWIEALAALEQKP